MTKGKTQRDSTEGSAAAKVLHLPELLDMILAELADQAVHEAAATQFPVYRADLQLEPARSLARLRGVDRTFRDRIDGSKQLQSSMTNANRDTSVSILSLAWLLQKQLRLDHEWTEDNAFVKPGVATSSYGFRGDCDEAEEKAANSKIRMRSLKQAPTGTSANWRHVQLRMAPRKNGSQHFIQLEVRFQPNNDFAQDYYHKCKIEDGTTLGDVFDEYEKATNRTYEQHMRASKTFWDEYDSE